MVGARADQLAARARVAELAAVTAGNGHGGGREDLAGARAALARAEHELAAALTALEELGVVVKDVDAGLVDFLSLRDGEQVCLCWQVGEPELAWWHGLEEGFQGRKPLD
jgi:hypothetical protein